MKPRKETWRVPLRNVFLSKRYMRAFVGIGLLFFTVGLFKINGVSLKSSDSRDALVNADPVADRLPPTYANYHKRERELPQHNLKLPAPNGKHAKYLWFSNHAHGSGFGNILQEVLTNSNLAWETGRAFVFHNYTWDRDGPQYVPYNGKLIPSRIPLSALISGPIIGGPFDTEHSHLPLSVSRAFFKSVCPNPVMLHYVDVPESYDGHLEGSEVLRLWAKKIKSIDDPCVMINPESPSVFDVWFFGNIRARSLYQSLSKSPSLTHFGWSPLVLSAFQTNIHIFSPRVSRFFFLFSSSSPSPIPAELLSPTAFPRKTALTTQDPIYDVLPNLLALHIRRGDFGSHCGMLGNWSANWNGFNRFESLPDQFTPPEGGTDVGTTTPENMELYMRKCFPSIPQIVQRIKEVRRDLSNNKQGVKYDLRDIYIMTNGKPPFLAALTAALRAADPGMWRSIKSGRDLKLNWEQKYVAQAVDMMVGQKAAVFIGNGFSSLTSNVVLIRMQRGITPETTRFW